MGLFRKLMDTMGLNNSGDEYDDYDDDGYYDDDYEEEAPRRGIFPRRNNNTNYDDLNETDGKARFGRSNPKVVPMRRGMEVTVIKPVSMEDSKEICDSLLDGKAVVINMEGIHMELAQRIFDFASGATYSLNGKLEKVSNSIIIATPNSVGLSGDFQDILAAGEGMGNVSGLNIRL